MAFAILAVLVFLFCICFLTKLTILHCAVVFRYQIPWFSARLCRLSATKIWRRCDCAPVTCHQFQLSDWINAMMMSSPHPTFASPHLDTDSCLCNCTSYLLMVALYINKYFELTSLKVWYKYILSSSFGDFPFNSHFREFPNGAVIPFNIQEESRMDFPHFVGIILTLSA